MIRWPVSPDPPSPPAAATVPALGRGFRVVAALLTLSGSFQSAPRAVAQLHGEAEAAAAVSPRDSARLLRDARRMQARFERVRRNHLPYTWGGGGGPCDERIGRFCLTYSDDDSPEWEPPPEDEEVTRLRGELIATLNRVAALIPGDAWVAGQRVRYLVEADYIASAETAADACRAEGWWCSALHGYTLHLAGEAERADSAFDTALSKMSPDEWEEWTDLSWILEPHALRAYRRLSDEERTRFERRFWSLADPFATRPGNETRSEHLSRHVMDRLQDRADQVEDLSWGSDLREILVRFGWPKGWERVRESRLGVRDGSIISHYADSGQNLVPPAELLVDSIEGLGAIWNDEPERPRAGYSLPTETERLKWLEPFDYQLAAFRRGDSVAVVAAYRVPRDSLPAEAVIEAGMALLSPGGARLAVETAPAAGPERALVATAPARPLIVSLEVVAPRHASAARVRRGISPPVINAGHVSLSELLLLDDTESLPQSLEEAVPLARSSSRVRPGETVGVYWEIYGPGTGAAELPVSLTLRKIDKGWLRRLAERVGIVRELHPVQMRWEEPALGADAIPRALTLQIPEVSPGSYEIRLRVGEVEVVREIELEF